MTQTFHCPSAALPFSLSVSGRGWGHVLRAFHPQSPEWGVAMVHSRVQALTCCQVVPHAVGTRLACIVLLLSPKQED